MSYLSFVQKQCSIVRDIDFKGAKLTRNYLDILFFIHSKKYSTISQISRELLHTNYIQTYQIINSMRALGLLNYFRVEESKGRSNWIFLTPEAEQLLKEIRVKYQFV